MKTTRHILAILALFLAHCMAQGQNTLSIPDVSAPAGGHITLPVKLDNTADVTAIQFTLTLPDGMTPDIGKTATTNRTGASQVALRGIAPNTYMAMLFSTDNTPVSGRTGSVIDIRLDIPATAREGERYPLTLSDVIIAAPDGSNIATGAASGSVTIAKSPDLTLEGDISADRQELMPGGEATVSWTVANIGGMETGGGFTEQLFLTDAPGNERYLLASTHCDDTLPAGARQSRSITFTLPDILGIDGAARLAVRLVPDSDCGEPEWHRGNNVMSATGTVNVAKKLTLTPEATVDEARGGELRLRLTRSGNTGAPGIFTIDATADSRIGIPAAITVPAGESTVHIVVTVTPDGVYDDNDAVTVTVSGGEYDAVESHLAIIDDTLPALTLSTETEEVREGDSAAFTLSVQGTRRDALDVRISCDEPTRFSLPESIAIPAGEQSVRFTVPTTDNSRPEQDADVVFSASAPGHISGITTLVLTDNDIPQLSIGLTPAIIAENAGPLAVRATVTRTGSLDSDLEIELSDNSANRIYYSDRRKKIPAGEKSVEFLLGPIDNADADGDCDVTLSAAVFIPSCSCAVPAGSTAGLTSATLTITDNDGPALELTSASTSVKEGASLSVTVSRNTATASALNVDITADPQGRMTFPATVTIPAGEKSASFEVSAPADDITDNSFTATLTASAQGFSRGTAYFLVTDETLPDIRVDSFDISADSFTATATATATVGVSNVGAYMMPERTKIGLYADGNAVPLVYLYLPENLEPGCSAVITREFTLPASVGEVSIHAVANDGDEVKELLYSNNMSQPVAIRLSTPMQATISTDKTTYRRGEPVTFSGHAAIQQGEIFVTGNGSTQTIPAEIDSAGDFTVTWHPYEAETGVFSFGMRYPGDVTAPVAGTFDITGLKLAETGVIRLEGTAGTPLTASIPVTNPSSTAISGIVSSVTTSPDNVNVTVTTPQSINAGHTENIELTLTADTPTSGNDWQKVCMAVTDGSGTAMNLTVFCRFRYASASLKSDVAEVNTTMTVGHTRQFPVTLTNEGAGETGEINILLPDWMSTATPTRMPSLASGESATVILLLTPPAGVNVNHPVTGRFVVSIAPERGNSLVVPFDINPVSETTGTVDFDVYDEYAFTTAEGPHLEGARVRLLHPVTSQEVFSGTTDATGHLTATVPEGYYKAEFTADRHYDYSCEILVDPGRTKRIPALLNFRGVEYSYDVVETEIEDMYSIVTTVKYETNVPAPVVVISGPERVDGDALRPGESLIFNMAVTNKGLVTAFDNEFIIPRPNDEFGMEALVDLTPFDLAPGQSRLIPVRLTRYGTRATVKASGVPVMDACMAGMADRYRQICHTDIRQNEAAFRMAFKACFLSTIMNGLMSGGGGGGPSGPGGGGGGGGTPGPSSENYGGSGRPPICDPELAAQAEKGINGALGFVPVVGPVISIVNNGVDFGSKPSMKGFVNLGLSLATPFAKPVANMKAGQAGLSPTMANHYGNAAGVAAQTVATTFDLATPDFMPPRTRSAGDYDWMVISKEKAKRFVTYMRKLESFTNEVFGDPTWYEAEPEEIMAFLRKWDELTDGDSMPDTDTLCELLMPSKPADITAGQVRRLVERTANTIGGQSAGGIDTQMMITTGREIMEYEQEAIDLGYTNSNERMKADLDEYVSRLEDSTSGVCASVTLQFNQLLTMTRQAFRGTLKVTNGHETNAMTDIRLNLTVTAPDGTQASSHLFQISPESLTGIQGALDFDNGWTLAASSSGKATILYIPTRYAAPDEPVMYSFGGSLSYHDPYTGMDVTRPLSPVQLTVKPSPTLDLTYFMQRDVFGDDPMTPETEPMQDAEFSLLINNVGRGDATDVRMSTQQPQIIENEKGLAVNFEIISSQLNGQVHTLALGGAVPTDFGTIAAGTQSYAQWWMHASLTGHFISYDVTATHLTSYGNPDLTLLGDVTIHELIRSLDTSDGLKAFLTNDLPDMDDLPDMLYLSDGNILPVAMASSATAVRSSATEYTLHVNPAAPGWNYGSITDPTYGRQNLCQVKRVSDGAVIPARNFWLTDRTLRDGQDPLYENRLHFADDFVAGTPETYLLTFEPAPEITLEVEGFTGIPAENSIPTAPVSSVGIRFNKPVKPSTFTTDDLTLTVQGVPCDISGAGIIQADAQTFTLDLTAIDGGDGFYCLTVQTAGITDTEGFTGKTGASASWLFYSDGTVTAAAVATPSEGGTVSPSADDSMAVTPGTEVRFEATAAPGYIFGGWMLGDNLLSSDNVLTRKVNDNLLLTAVFTPATHNVTVVADEGGETDSLTGHYSHGTRLTLTARPYTGYMFDRWLVNDVPVDDPGSVTTAADGSGSQLSVTVTGDTDIRASFIRTQFTQRHIVPRGWSWISSYVDSDMDLAPVMTAFTECRTPQGTAPNTVAARSMARIKASTPFVIDATGTPLTRSMAPLPLAAGLTGIAMPYMQPVALEGSVATPAENDAVIGLEGFSVFAGGRWQGTLRTLVPGNGYLYRTDGNGSLQWNPEPETAESSDDPALTYEHPEVMNLIARLILEGEGIDCGDYDLYAVVGDEIRGEATVIGDAYFLTVHGDAGQQVVLRAKERGTSRILKSAAPMEFREGVSGLPVSPCRINVVPDGSSIDTLVAEGTRVTVYSLDGILLLYREEPERLRRLSTGLYIVNGEKMHINNMR